MPVRVGKGNGHWELRDLSVEADIQSLALNIQSAAWIRFMTWWLQHVEPNMPIIDCRGLHQFGYAVTVKGIPKRLYSSHSYNAGKALWTYFHPGERMVQRHCHAPWCVHKTWRVVAGCIHDHGSVLISSRCCLAAAAWCTVSDLGTSILTLITAVDWRSSAKTENHHQSSLTIEPSLTIIKHQP